MLEALETYLVLAPIAATALAVLGAGVWLARRRPAPGVGASKRSS